jgi:hypothetical protein
MTMPAIKILDEGGDGYRPGACNIGPAEIERRRRSGIAGMLAAAALAIVLVVVDAAPLVRLTVAAPLFFGFLGLVQARLHFCVGFGLAGMRNFGSLGSAARVEDRAAHAADVRRAIGVAAALALASAVIAVGFALLPI